MQRRSKGFLSSRTIEKQGWEVCGACLTKKTWHRGVFSGPGMVRLLSEDTPTKTCRAYLHVLLGGKAKPLLGPEESTAKPEGPAVERLVLAGLWLVCKRNN
jgi:hypothetical protein